MNSFRLNILHQIEYFAKANLSRQGEIIWEIVQTLADKQHRNYIFCTGSGRETISENIKNIDIYHIPIRQNFFYPQKDEDRPFKNKFKKILSEEIKPDLIHIHSGGKKAKQLRKYCLKHSIPYFVTLADDAFDTSANLLLQDAAGIICYHKNIYHEICREFGKDRSHLSSVGVHIRDYQSIERLNFRLKYRIPMSVELLLCEADFLDKNNHLLLLDIVSAFRKKKERVHLVLIGKIISNDYFSALLHRIEELKIRSAVTIITDIGSNSYDMYNLYNTADYLILPSEEVFAREIVLKAWCSRLPVILSEKVIDSSLMRNMENCILFRESKTVDILQCMETLKLNTAIRIRLIRNSFEEAKNKFTWYHIVDELVKFYKKNSA